MAIPTSGWSNRGGTSQRDSCKCGSWKEHWLIYSGKEWPKYCSVKGCSNPPTLGAHVRNLKVSGERIVPMCDSCNKLKSIITLKPGVSVPSANRSKTCESESE